MAGSGVEVILGGVVEVEEWPSDCPTFLSWDLLTWRECVVYFTTRVLKTDFRKNTVTFKVLCKDLSDVSRTHTSAPFDFAGRTKFNLTFFRVRTRNT